MSLDEIMASELQLPVPLIRGIARKASHAYKEYEIPKRTGGSRTIHHPSRELKALQRWLLTQVIGDWPVHDAAYAYHTGVSIRANAERHATSRYLLRMDLADFFPSITADDIQEYLLQGPPDTEDWDDEDRHLFIQLVCRWDRLTIGAPTSPSLSNALCCGLDSELTEQAENHEVTYTRYADDLFFSCRHKDVLGDFPDLVSGVLDNLELPNGLQVNAEKTRHSSKKGRRQVTGLVLTSQGGVSIGRKRKRFIRRQIHRIDELDDDERTELAGLLSFAFSIEPDLLNRLILKYGPEPVARARAGE